MKRCPECRRDYYDDTLLYCLDDGNALLEGPAARFGIPPSGGSSPDEPTTAILSEPGAVAAGFLSGDEPATAIMSEPPAVAGGLTGMTDESQLKTAILQPPATAGGSDSKTAILQPPATAGGSDLKTAILQPPATAGGSDLKTAILQPPATAGGSDSKERQSLSANRAAEPRGKVGGRQRRLAAVGIVALVLVGGFFGYRYFNSDSSGTINSIAVLPFQNRSDDADTEYLSDGLAESLIFRLTQLPGLKVSPTSSVMRYKGNETDLARIASELGVDSVMTGRLLKRGDNLDIAVELVDTRNNKSLWGEQYQRKMSDLLDTQRDIAATIAQKLQLKLKGDEKGLAKKYTDSNEAYQLYLKGRYYWNKRTADNLKRSIELLKSAVEKDPNFALAYAGLADCYVVLPTYTGERSNEIMPIAKSYAEKSILLDPTLAEPHASLALVTWFNDWDKDKAESEFKKAIDLNPNYPTAHQWYQRFLRTMNRGDEAFNEIKRAEEIEPLSLIFINNVAEMQIERHEFEAAYETCRRMSEMDPNFWATQQTLVYAYVSQGRYLEALTAAQKSVDLSGRANASLAQLGFVLGRLGRPAEAEPIVKELEAKYENKTADARDVADVYAGLGNKDKAFEWLEKGFAYRSFNLAGLTLDPLLDPLKDDPRWNDLQRRIGLP